MQQKEGGGGGNIMLQNIAMKLSNKCTLAGPVRLQNCNKINDL